MTKQANQSRRKWLKSAGLVSGLTALSVIGYSLHRGIRYPTLGLEPLPLPAQFDLPESHVRVLSADVMRVFQSSLGAANHEHPFAHLRAFAPEPTIEIHPNKTQSLRVRLSNISPKAELYVEGNGHQVNETVDGIHRNLALKVQRNQPLTLKWKLPKTNDFTFAAIGDSGGDKELAWCLKRAHQLGADFLLHLGDFNYQAGDYDRSIRLFNESAIPCYVSIGNHDFHDNGRIYPQFLSELGPLNNAFTIGETRFVNIDTAASMLPYGAGKRGKLVSALAQQNDYVADTVSFTHRPLHDPQPNSTHDIGSEGERDWLIRALKRLNSTTLLSGHIHIYDRSTFNGIDNIIAGQGLGHQDILTRSDYSKIVLGEVGTDGKVSYRPEPLNMPLDLHCHPRSQSARDALSEGTDPLTKMWRDQLEKACG